MGLVVSWEVFWRFWSLVWQPMGICAGWDVGQIMENVCTGMSQHWALCSHQPPQRDDKTSCFSPKLCSLAKEINEKDTEKEGQMACVVWAGCMVTAHPWDATHVPGQIQQGTWPLLPSVQQCTFVTTGLCIFNISQDLCDFQGRCVINKMKYFAKCRKTSLIPGTAVADFHIAAITCLSWTQKKSVVSLVCPWSCSMTPLVAHRMSSSFWSCFTRWRGCSSCWTCLLKLMQKVTHTVLSYETLP